MRRKKFKLLSMLLAMAMLVSMIDISAFAAVREGSVPTSASETMNLTLDGQTNSVIVLPTQASEKEVYAAQELQKHVKLVSGANVPIVRSDNPNGSGISADLSTREISAPRVGYYPFTITVSNNNAEEKSLTLTADTADGSPKVEIRGQDGKEAGELVLEPHTTAVVNALVTVDANTSYGVHMISISLTSGSTSISSHVLKVNCPEPNMLKNGDIEGVSFAPWWQTPDFYPDPAMVHSGSKSIRLNGIKGTSSGYEGAQLLKSGYAYELTFWAKRNSDSQAGVKMQFTEFGYQVENKNRASTKTFALTPEWKKYSMQFYNNPSLNGDYTHSWLNIYLAEAGIVWLDDFVLKEIGKIENYTPPETRINLVRDGSFEYGDYWGIIPDGGGSRVKTDDAIDGEYVFFVDRIAANPAYNGNTTDNIGPTLLANHVYTLGFDAKRGGDNPDGWISYAMFKTGSDTGHTIMAVTPANDWTRYEMNFESGLVNLDYWVNIFVPGKSGSISIDNISLYDLGEKNENVDYKLNEIKTKPSVKTSPDGNGTIVPPDMGDKPELELPKYDTIQNGVTIFISTSESLPELKQKYADDITYIGGSDGFAVRRDENTVYIFGTKADGTLNGVYDFIESNLGVLWTRSTDIGTLYDPMPSIALVKLDYRDKSPLDIRGWHLCGIGANGEAHSDHGTEIMMSRNKLNAKFAEFGNLQYWDWQKSIGLEPVNMGHNLHYWLLQSPTYNALSNTEKAKCWNTDDQGNPSIGNGQLNFWNPNVAVAIAESVNAFLDEHPEIKFVGVGQEDTASYVQKPEDTQPFEYAPGQSVQPGDPKYLSTVFFSFNNKVAKIVKEKHPDVMLTTYAYSFSETPPYCEVEDNIAIVIAPLYEDMKLPLADPNANGNRHIADNMREWANKANYIMVYNYYGCFDGVSNEFERPIASRMQSDFRFYVENGFKGLLPEGLVDVGNNMWAVNTLHLWLYSKLAWNPDANIQDLTALFCQKAYGAAANDMLEYYRLLDETWQNNYTNVLYNTSLYTYIRTFYGNPEHNALMQAALNQAWNAANDTQKQRIRPIKEAFERNTKKEESAVETASAKKTGAGLENVLKTFDMNDPIWSNSPVLENFLDAVNRTPVEGTKTKVRLLWDEEYLYIAYENFDNNISAMLKDDGVPSSAGDWWKGLCDDVQTFLASKDPRGNPNAEYRFYATSPLAGQIVYREANQYLPDPGVWYNSVKIFDEAGVENDRWVTIQAIPFEHLGINGAVTSDTDLYGYFFWTHFLSSSSLKLIGWNGASVKDTASFKRITLLGDTKEPETYTVTFNTDGGSAVADQAVTQGSKATKPADPTKAGYTFQGWYTDETYTAAFNFDAAITGNMTAYAKWTEVKTPAEKYTVTFNSNGGSAVPAMTDITSGSAITAPAAPTREGYTFKGWYKDEALETAWNFETDEVTANITLYAKWTQNSSGGENGGGNSGPTITYHTITANVGEGGKISPQTSSVQENTSKTFTIAPDEGYEIADVTVDGKSVGAVTTYTFSNVTSGHNINATFKKIEAPEKPEEPKIPEYKNQFADVSENQWFYDSVMYVYNHGLMSGVSTDKFNPLENGSRGMIVTILYTLEGRPEAAANSFKDVTDGKWYTDAIAWAAENKIVSGYGNGLFRPNDNITREQMVAIFYNYAKHKGYDLSKTSSLERFTDSAKVSDWASEAMQWMVGSGIMSGKGNNLLDPKGTATRAEMASIMQKFAEKYTF